MRPSKFMSGHGYIATKMFKVKWPMMTLLMMTWTNLKVSRLFHLRLVEHAASLLSQHPSLEATLASMEMTTATLPPFNHRAPIHVEWVHWWREFFTCRYMWICWGHSLETIFSQCHRGKQEPPLYLHKNTSFVHMERALNGVYFLVCSNANANPTPTKTLKTKHHMRFLGHWNTGDIDALTDECRTIKSVEAALSLPEDQWQATHDKTVHVSG